MATTVASTEAKSSKAAPRTASSKPAASKSATAKKPAAKKAVPAKAAAPVKAPASASTPAAVAKPKDTGQTLKAHGEHVDRIWQLAKRIGICMFVTWDGERQRVRPLAATVERDEHAIYFLTDVHSHKDEQVEKFPIVALAFADMPHSKYVSITGKATVSNDRAQIRKLWSPFAQAWWDSAEDPDIRVIKVEPQDAELWDSPGRIVSTISMLAAAVTRRSPRIGENAKVTL